MNKQQIQSILDNAPEGATHYDSIVYYRARFNGSSLNAGWSTFNQGNSKWESVGDCYLTDVYKIVSLDDLRTQLSLIEENEKLKDALNAALRACYDVDAYGVRETNSDYLKACELQDEIEELSND